MMERDPQVVVRHGSIGPQGDSAAAAFDRLCEILLLAMYRTEQKPGFGVIGVLLAQAYTQFARCKPFVLLHQRHDALLVGVSGCTRTVWFG
jgi:hypothetical protein